MLKLVSQGREEFIPQIKAVLDEPEAILRDSDNSFLFVKHLKDEDYFVNVSVDKGEYAVSISNGIKEAFYFYKPFLDSKGVLNLVSVQIPKSNRLQYKTSYIASKQRMMKILTEYELVYDDFT